MTCVVSGCLRQADPETGICVVHLPPPPAVQPLLARVVARIMRATGLLAAA